MGLANHCYPTLSFETIVDYGPECVLERGLERVPERVPERVRGAAAESDMRLMPWHPAEQQRILVLGPQPPALEPVCSALDMQPVRVTSYHEMPFMLHHHTPMGVICVIDPVGRDICRVLRGIAGYNPDLPVLIVANDDPACLGVMDAAEQLWGLTGLHTIPQDPAPGDLVTFLFHAGRHGKTGRLLPVS